MPHHFFNQMGSCYTTPNTDAVPRTGCRVMDGQQALQEIRRIEERHGIRGLDMVKVIMVTAVDDSSNIMKAFRQGQCEAYLTKPLNREKLITQPISVTSV